MTCSPIFDTSGSLQLLFNSEVNMQAFTLNSESHCWHSRLVEGFDTSGCWDISLLCPCMFTGSQGDVIRKSEFYLDVARC